MFNSQIYSSRRFWEVDFVRGLGIIMMVISNFITDLQYFLNYSEHQMFWRIFAYTTASIFVFISGLSFWISYSRSIKKNPRPYKKYLKRFAKLFGLGILITITTKVLLSSGTIYFGVLHFLGVASLLAIPFYRFREKNIFFAVFFLLGSLIVSRITVNSLLLLPIGITPSEFFTLDYFPIFPWFGVYLLGMTIGSLLYPDGTRRFSLNFPKMMPVEFICLAGRHTLKIYLVHQPVLVGLLLLIYGSLPNLSL
ncbi:heparan-alpha-glucosaminide N-acetyltransferase [Thermococcus paralvinellae]|uniref:Heparan-alpha-glucosaminide N-acetyltransferase catalytic domain-containing protein n=1 Tax=Thermococcus paralvinellae TaxID=582419 RepID=W0I6M0_9EURY|nr:heparan-alpha-glucosaminide N-acetyltransferase [Thermococcus paralvinellae]AHF80090.1 Hypothetical protein TES1_0704 [Thermococcus paralvinellae]